MFVHNGENIHSDEKKTLDNALQKIEEGSSAIQNFTRHYTRTISDLERQATEKTQLIEELTQKLEKSEKKAKEAQRKAEDVSDFKNTNYASLIQEIFERPKEKFGKSMLDQSNKSVNIVIKYAVISVVISLAIVTISSISTTLYILKINRDATENITTNIQELINEADAGRAGSRDIDDRRNRR